MVYISLRPIATNTEAHIIVASEDYQPNDIKVASYVS